MKLAAVSTSSLIGVAIACSGNVLISLALTVQKLAHKRQRDELIASQSSSGSSSPSPDEPNVDPGPDQTDSDNTYHDEHSPTPSPRPKVAAAVPVALAPSSSGQQQGDALLISLEPGTGKSQDTVRAHRGRSPDGERTVGEEISVEPVRLVPVPVEARSRTRSLSPLPIPIPPGYKTDIDLSDQNTPRPPKKAHSRHAHHDSHQDHGDDKPRVEEGMYLKSRLWWLGLSLIAVGEGGNFLSYGFAPASVVAPLGTVALIANCIFAPLILREKFHAKELIGMGLAIVGAVTVVYSSKASNPRLDPQALVVAIRQIPFIVYSCLNLILMVILSLLSRSQYYGSKYTAIDVGVCALFGGYTVLSTKALSSLLSTIFLAAFADWITWVLVLVLVVTSILQVKFLNRALMRFQSKEVIPTQFVFFSLAAIVGSAVLYQELRDVSPSSFINFVFGIATTFLGVHLLTSFSEDDTSDTASEHSDATSRTATYRPFARSVPTNASLNVLLPTTSRLSSHNGLPSSFSERTPLLVPIASPEALERPQSPGELGPSSLGRIRLIKKASNGDFTPTLGLGSQAGFLLMATTPPSAPPPGILGRRAASYLRRAGDEESSGRRASTGRGRSAERSNTVPE